jgi:hypothetical protein
MKVRRTKPYVCVDVDFADHFRFQATVDLDAAAGVWLQCLAHSRGQEQDGVVTAAWLRRTFAASYGRVEELVKVGLLCARPDGDYEIHAYAPRNQTRDMLSEERTATRERVREWRSSKRPAVTRYKGVTSDDVTSDERASHASTPPDDALDTRTGEANGSHERAREGAASALASSDALVSTDPSRATERQRNSTEYARSQGEHEGSAEDDVTRYTAVTVDPVTEYETGCNALVPTSTSINSSLISSSSFLLSSDPSLRSISGDTVRAITRAHPREREERTPLPASERGLSGSFWLAAFSDGIADGTARPCTVGRMYLGTLERIVTHHAPERDASRASVWLKAQARAFAAQWDGKHPAKGLTPDGLERWLNEGRQGPPVFGRPRIVQPSAEDWHEDDWSDLGAKVGE